jgi:hypothetical protein
MRGGEQMTADAEHVSRLLGGIIGVALAGYFWVYLPMSRNYAECGTVFLCANQAKP